MTSSGSCPSSSRGDKNSEQCQPARTLRVKNYDLYIKDKVEFSYNFFKISQNLTALSTDAFVETDFSIVQNIATFPPKAPETKTQEKVT
ncbi:hypothetical protein Hamer_G024058 [Homarus americanus]|uniref:Uncharacterized protein n=1 Tax=Homarus americanus TaxID=6706 RepID=A0A8J5JEQ0_HOMAM|nr:hypothetical protein Hamer_G024058 [Homarus americanus]